MSWRSRRVSSYPEITGCKAKGDGSQKKILKILHLHFPPPEAQLAAADTDKSGDGQASTSVPWSVPRRAGESKRGNRRQVPRYMHTLPSLPVFAVQLLCPSKQRPHVAVRKGISAFRRLLMVLPIPDLRASGRSEQGQCKASASHSYCPFTTELGSTTCLTYRSEKHIPEELHQETQLWSPACSPP